MQPSAHDNNNQLSQLCSINTLVCVYNVKIKREAILVWTSAWTFLFDSSVRVVFGELQPLGPYYMIYNNSYFHLAPNFSISFSCYSSLFLFRFYISKKKLHTGACLSIFTNIQVSLWYLMFSCMCALWTTTESQYLTKPTCWARPLEEQAQKSAERRHSIKKYSIVITCLMQQWWTTKICQSDLCGGEWIP